MRQIGKVLLKIFFIASFLFLGYQSYHELQKLPYFSVQYVRVYGAQHIDHVELQNLVKPLVAHNFFTVDMELIKDRLRQFPWVEEISIRRIWPDQVNILITEHHPVAHWHEGTLLSANGDLFPLGKYKSPENLPYFIGPDGKQGLMQQFFNDFDRELFPLHAKITTLELTPYQGWRLTLDNGIRLHLGHKNILTHLSQFVKVYPKV